MVVKADGYGHGMVHARGPPAEAGAAWLGVATPNEALALRAAGDRRAVLAWLYGPEEDLGAAGRRRGRRLGIDRRSGRRGRRRGRPRRASRPAAPQGGHRVVAQRRAARGLAERLRGRGRGTGDRCGRGGRRLVAPGGRRRARPPLGRASSSRHSGSRSDRRARGRARARATALGEFRRRPDRAGGPAAIWSGSASPRTGSTRRPGLPRWPACRCGR